MAKPHGEREREPHGADTMLLFIISHMETPHRGQHTHTQAAGYLFIHKWSLWELSLVGDTHALHSHTHRKPHRNTLTDTHRHRHIDTDRHIHKQTDRQTDGGGGIEHLFLGVVHQVLQIQVIPIVHYGLLHKLP